MKKIIYKKYIVATFLMLIGFALHAQQKSADLKAANTTYKKLRYLETIQLLKPILAKEPDNTNAIELMANSYRLTKQYPEALLWYEKLSNKANVKPEWALRYAEALANSKEYEKSELLYRKYLSLVPSDRRAALFSEADISGMGKEVSWEVNYLNVNTAASEYSPMIYKNGLVFTSNRYYSETVKHVFAWDNTPFSNLFIVKDINSIQKTEAKATDSISTLPSAKKRIYNDDDTPPTSNDTKIVGAFDTKVYSAAAKAEMGAVKVEPFKGNINTKFHEGASALLPDGSIIFTRNNYFKGKKGKTSDGVVKLKMFTAKSGNYDEIIAFPYNSDSYSVGHPTVSADGKLLVFSSDMPGGSGGNDLYYSTRLDDKSDWGRPVNLGRKVNTEGDEEFPYFDDQNVLYFSSTGLAGLGGFDVFFVALKDLKPVGNPKNLGAPFNSSFDDFGVAKTDKTKGYFSSNRLGTDDIYSFVKKEFKIILKGKVTDATTGLPLTKALVTLRNGNVLDTLLLNENGEFEKPLVKDVGYELKGTLKDFLPDRRYIGTDGIQGDSTIYVPIQLIGTDDKQKFVINHCDSLKKVFKVENIYYDLDKFFIRNDALYNLDRLTDLLTKYPDITVITRSHCDSRASENYNRTLSLNRGKSAKAYLVKKGIDTNRISVQYFGKSKLVNGCTDGVACTEEEQQMNRRTEFEIVYKGINLSLIDCK